MPNKNTFKAFKNAKPITKKTPGINSESKNKTKYFNFYFAPRQPLFHRRV